MDNNDHKSNDIRIEQVNPRTELNDLEKTAILQFEFEKKQEELSKTQKFQLLNSRKKSEDAILPKLKDKLSNTMEIILPKRKANLSETIKIKISDLREKIDELELDLPKPKKSLYDTVIIKLDDLINKKNALKRYESKKVTSIEDTKYKHSKLDKKKAKDITKMKDIKLNVDSEEYGKQLYNLNKIALNNLSYMKSVKVRRYSSLYKLDHVDNVHISKAHYSEYQKKLNKFAINKLYYKFAPKETNKYKLYKYSVFLSSFVLVITGLIIVNWCVQGVQINSLSNAIIEDTDVTPSTEGEIIGVEETDDTSDSDADVYTDESSMYWKYLNTPLSSVNFDSLLRQNKDTIGWLIVNNTNVNYPVVQSTDNEYYLTHAFDGTRNSAGWVYADFRDNFDVLSKNTVIYAHGRKDKVMFGSLTNALNASWYTNTDNQIIQFSTLKYNTMWQIFSVYKIEAESYYITTDFSNDDSFATFASTMKSRSIYDFGVNITSNDKILTLSTCYNDNGIRLVVQAKLVKIQER